MDIKTYIVASHIFYTNNKLATYGPANSIVDFLVKKKREVYFIKHSLNNKINSFLYDKETVIGQFPVKYRDILLKSIRHCSINYSVIRHFIGKKNIIYIGIDPVNSLSGIVLRLLHKINKNIYFTADYADRRFDNFFLDQLYHFLDRICLKFADEVWCVSSRIVKKRIQQGVKRYKIKFVPNSPDQTEIPLKRTMTKTKNLIIVANLTKSLDLIPILEAFKITLKNHSDLCLQIVGSGPKENYFKEIVKNFGLEKKVKFLGQKNHLEVLKLIANSFLGFALYTLDNTWNLYGDSMKAREYIACGIPVIINNVPSTSDDIRDYNSGLVMKDVRPEGISNFINNCLENKNFYQSLRKNTLRLAKDFDKNTILTKIFLMPPGHDCKSKLPKKRGIIIKQCLNN